MLLEVAVEAVASQGVAVPQALAALAAEVMVVLEQSATLVLLI